MESQAQAVILALVDYFCTVDIADMYAHKKHSLIIIHHLVMHVIQDANFVLDLQ